MERTRKRFVENREPLVQGDLDTTQVPSFVERLLSTNSTNDQIFSAKSGTQIKFKNDFCRQVYYLCRLGARNQDIADFFKVSLRTIEEWSEGRSQVAKDFQDSVLEGRWISDMKVAETLGKRAMGYDFTEIEIAEHVTRNGEIVETKKVTHKHMPPDTVAIIFWLKNRRRDLWADVNKTEVDAKYQIDISKKLDLSIMTEEEKALIKSIAIKQLAQVHGISNN